MSKLLKNSFVICASAASIALVAGMVAANDAASKNQGPDPLANYSIQPVPLPNESMPPNPLPSESIPSGTTTNVYER